MSFRKVFIVGAGAIGSCYGAMLSCRNDVTLVGSRAHVDAINSRGLEVGGELEGTFRIRAETSMTDPPPGSLVILTTKAQHAAKAAAAMRGSLRGDTALLVLQNGLGIKEAVKKAIGGRSEVVRGLTMMAAEFMEPGKVTYWRGATVIERSKAGERIRNLFAESGLETRLASDIRREEWRKLAANCVINPLTSILGARDDEISAPCLKETRRMIVEECRLVAEAEGIILGRGLASETDRTIAGYTNRSSMHQDLLKGKTTEIDFLNGKVVDLGRKHGIGTPANEAMAGIIRFLEGRR